ncbi:MULTISPECIES: hypothetical protein [unclassified Mesorhizobium]|uniref:hypothetical protein n=1 Tax=unclassified Mesorhizobium TaxID=325217 RepID=UPI00112901FA|nr:MULTISPECIES: hypothetical protein [unclassified Mesorhizobium]TPK66265.1 hypothetical protein FJ551_09180 [Mesorhizobium sp. B2-5-1]TPM60643.1 hypothetical protein FJ962_16035 [Mesorhizobium sp. B2-1-9]TPM88026.1 hypothetical protein FJ963_03510 [Mesorhizobium sp. B2-1-4]TPN11054.1 hypothetical protein FJ971_13200 [Mesorhizobium sp. B2-1-2]UCI14739.1 hypothetical protein FJ972_07740 [Mesorhizobium sp. B2-1-1]
MAEPQHRNTGSPFDIVELAVFLLMALGAIIERLVKETGIAENQAREPISFLGFNWSSLVRKPSL